MYTMNRAAFGDQQAALMSGMGGSGYGYGYPNDPLSQVGGQINPISYAPMMRVSPGYYGQTQQRMGLMSGVAGMMGLGTTPRGSYAADHHYNQAADFGERMGGFAMGGASSVIGTAAGMALPAMMGVGLVGSLGIGIGATMVANLGVNSAMQRREISSFLESSSSRYVSPSSGMSDKYGRGMGSEARMQVTDFARKLDLNDPTMGSEDISNILQGATKRGLFTGTQDVKEFQSRFKEITESVKVVTKALGQSLEEGLNTLKELKSIGVGPGGQSRQMVGLAQSTGLASGRSASEMMNIGLQGAELFRGTGVNMGIGAQATMMNLASVRASRDAGTLSDEVIAQAGGEESLALRMNASGLAFAQSGMGRGMGAAFFNGQGMNTSGFMKAMMGGNMNAADLAMQAAANLSSPAGVIKYQANQEKFTTEMGKTFGGQGLQMMQMGSAMANARFMAQNTGASMNDAFRVSLQQQGMSNPQIEAMMGQINGAEKGYASSQASLMRGAEKSQIELAYQSNKLFGVGDKILDHWESFKDRMGAPMARGIESIKQGVQNVWEKQVLGINRVSYQGLGERKYAAAIDTGRVDLSQGGGLAGTTAGEEIMKAVDSNPELAKALGVKISRGGDVKVGSDYMGERTITKGELESVKQKAYLGMSNDQAAKVDTSNVRGGLITAIRDSKFSSINTMEGLVQAAFGKGLGEVGETEMAKLYQDLAANPDAIKNKGLLDSVKKFRKDAGSLSGASGKVTAMEGLKAQEEMQQIQDDLGLGKLSHGLAAEVMATARGDNGGVLTDTAMTELVGSVGADEASRISNSLSKFKGEKANKALGLHAKALDARTSNAMGKLSGVMLAALGGKNLVGEEKRKAQDNIDLIARVQTGDEFVSAVMAHKEDAGETLVKQAEKMTDMNSEEREKAFQKFTSETAGGGEIIGATGATTSGTGQEAITDNIVQQTSINATILQTLLAMKANLDAKK